MFALGYKAVDGSRAIWSRVEFEGHATNGGRSDGRTGAGDGSGTTKCCEPDHDLILGRARCGGGREQVVGYIGDNA